MAVLKYVAAATPAPAGGAEAAGGAAGAALAPAPLPAAAAESKWGNNLYGHICCLLDGFSEQRSYREMSRDIKRQRSRGGKVNPGNASLRVVQQLSSCIAAHEMNITKEAIELAHVVGLGQDAKDNVLLVSIRMVLWQLPRGWCGIWPDGFKQIVSGAAGA